MNPFDQLRDDDRTVTPDPRFARRLRARIEAEFAPTIDLPDRKSTTMSNTDDNAGSTENPTTGAAPAQQIITPYISVHDGAGALDWYVTALGATETVRYVGDDGRLGHAEFVLHGATIMLSDAYPEIGVVAATSYEGSSCALHVEVPDADAAHDLAVANGATSLSAPGDQPHGARTATILDPYGHRWMLSHQISQLSHAEINDNYDDYEVVPATSAAMPTPPASSDGGDVPIQVGYYTIHTADISKAATFYSQLMGWNVDPASGHVDNCDLPFGFQNQFADPVRLWHTSHDLDAMIERAIELGGSVISDETHPSGRAVAMLDDQGARLDLHHPAPGYD